MPDFLCPYCGGTWTRIRHTYPHGPTTRRRHECQTCRRRFSTEEAIIPKSTDPLHIAFSPRSTRRIV